MQFLNSTYFFWAILALPAMPMALAATGIVAGPGLEDLLHPSGEFAA